MRVPIQASGQAKRNLEKLDGSKLSPTKAMEKKTGSKKKSRRNQLDYNMTNFKHENMNTQW